MDGSQVGAKLRDARVARGLSLEDIASTTKVPRSMLVLLETDAYQKMPAPVFVRGFIRSYAKVVGLDANPIVRAYEQRAVGLEHSVQSTPQPNEPQRPGAVREPRSRVGLNTDRKLTPVEPLSEPREGMFRGGYALLAVVAVGLLIAAWLMVGGKRNNMSETTSARVNEPIGVELPREPAQANQQGLESGGWTSVPPAETRAPPINSDNLEPTPDPSIGNEPTERAPTTNRPRASAPRSNEERTTPRPSGSSRRGDDEE